MAVMVTTEDNPFDPRLDFPAWHAWDTQKGYNTCAYLARAANVTDDFPETYNERLLEKVIDEMIAAHDGALYKKLEVEAA
jgi:hypothetical protein